MLELLLSHNANVNLQNKKGITALMTASINDCHKLIPYLIKSNANINLRNNNGDSALMIATKEGHYYAFKALIEAGAETDIKNNYGDSVFEIAEKKRKKTIHNYLKKKFYNKEIIQTGGAKFSKIADRVLLVLLSPDKTTEKINLTINLIKTNPDILNENDESGKTLLYFAIIYKSFEIIKTMIEIKPELLHNYIYLLSYDRTKTVFNSSIKILPLQVAILNDCDIEIINALIEGYPQAVNMYDSDNLSTLEYAEHNTNDNKQEIIDLIKKTQLLLEGEGGDAVFFDIEQGIQMIEEAARYVIVASTQQENNIDYNPNIYETTDIAKLNNKYNLGVTFKGLFGPHKTFEGSYLLKGEIKLIGENERSNNSIVSCRDEICNKSWAVSRSNFGNDIYVGEFNKYGQIEGEGYLYKILENMFISGTWKKGVYDESSKEDPNFYRRASIMARAIKVLVDVGNDIMKRFEKTNEFKKTNEFEKLNQYMYCETHKFNDKICDGIGSI
jgi:ankyrin repeat protein